MGVSRIFSMRMKCSNGLVAAKYTHSTIPTTTHPQQPPTKPHEPEWLGSGKPGQTHTHTQKCTCVCACVYTLIYERYTAHILQWRRSSSRSRRQRRRRPKVLIYYTHTHTCSWWWWGGWLRITLRARPATRATHINPAQRAPRANVSFGLKEY